MSRRGRFLLAALAVIFFAVFFGARRDASRRAAEGFYFGELSDGRAVSFVVHDSETNATARLHWDGRAGFELLNGPNPRAGELSFECDTNDDPVAARKLSGRLAGNPPVFSGTLALTNAPEGVAIIATNIAILETLHRRRGFKIGDRGGGSEFTATWPRFTADDPFLSGISTLLAHDATSAADFVDNGYENAWDGLKSGSSSYDWDSTQNYQTWWFSPDLVSLHGDWSEYSGGAHPNHAIVTRNFLRLGDRPKEFTLTNIFRTNVDWQTKLSGICSRELREQGASGLATPPVQKLTADNLATFNLDAHGLTIHFSPYAVASYAEGSFHVIIPWPEVRPLLDPNGPARLIPGAVTDARKASVHP